MVLASGLCATPSHAAPCEPARLVVEGPALPEEWRRAAADLTAVLGEEGHLWSCAAGDLKLAVSADHAGATLLRRDPRGGEAARHVPSPGDLVATAEALLARFALPTLAEPPPAPPPAVSPPAPAPTAPAPRPPRLVVEALVGARGSGTLRALWGAGTLRIAVPLDAWSVGAWVRYGLPYVFDRTPVDFSMSDFGSGLSVGRRLLAAGPMELHVTFDPSIGFVSMEGGTESNLAQGAKLDARLGLGARGTLRFTRMWHGVVALDGEIAPASAAKARHIDPALPPLPAYSLGASVGVSAVFR
jgi:hypothetical protein